MLKHNYQGINSDDPSNQTCFEILGFDIMLDKNLKPWLLEVNHSPSFQTGSNTDIKVKSLLIYDTLKLLNLNMSAKEKLLNLEHEKNELRQRTGRRTRLNEGLMREEFLQKRDEFIKSNLGGFELIYPPKDEKLELYYKEIINRAEHVYDKFTGAGDTSKVLGYERMLRVTNLPSDQTFTYTFNDMKKIYSSQFQTKFKKSTKIKRNFTDT